MENHRNKEKRVLIDYMLQIKESNDNSLVTISYSNDELFHQIFIGWNPTNNCWTKMNIDWNPSVCEVCDLIDSIKNNYYIMIDSRY